MSIAIDRAQAFPLTPLDELRIMEGRLSLETLARELGDALIEVCAQRVKNSFQHDPVACRDLDYTTAARALGML